MCRPARLHHRIKKSRRVAGALTLYIRGSTISIEAPAGEQRLLASVDCVAASAVTVESALGVASGPYLLLRGFVGSRADGRGKRAVFGDSPAGLGFAPNFIHCTAGNCFQQLFPAVLVLSMLCMWWRLVLPWQ